MRFKAFPFALFLAAGAGLACQPGGAKTTAQAPDSASAAVLAQSVNAFACDLYRQLDRTPGNLTFSPLSVSAAMGLVYAGAGGGTRSEMQGVLHLPADSTRAYEGYRSLFALLDEHARAGDSHWNLANRIWVQSGMGLQPAFTRTTKESFRSEAGELDFQRSPEPARASMNQWVEKQTDSQIHDLFPNGSIDANTRLVIANAVYFKGRWAEPFDPSRTRPDPFHLTASSDASVPMMRMTRSFGFARIPGGRLLEISYRGEQLSMLILLPDSIDGLASFESRLGADSLHAWTSRLGEHEVILALPRFTATSQFTLSQTLATLGMPSAFDGSKADFSRMDGKRDLYVSLVVHKALVDVSEEGTTAAAATGGEVTTATTPVTAEPETFYADHPFLFLIRDRTSDCILFMGRVSDPTH